LKLIKLLLEMRMKEESKTSNAMNFKKLSMGSVLPQGFAGVTRAEETPTNESK
jgi:hypothetical protein